MPTYTVVSRRGLIGQERRADIAGLLTDIHAEVTQAPRYLVQVLFTELETDAMFLAGRPAPEGHVWIRADVRSGRTREQKTNLIQQATGKVADLLGFSPEHVWVYLNEIPGENMTEYGAQLPEPGQEEQWFSALPPDLRERLQGLR